MRFNGTRSYIILEKLKALKSRIKIWNREVFGKVEDSKKTALARVDFGMRWKARELCQVKSWKREREPSLIIKNGLLWKRPPGDKNPNKFG